MKRTRYGRFQWVWVLALLAVGVQQGRAESEPQTLIPRAALFADPRYRELSVSPDGTRIAWLSRAAGVGSIWLAPVDRPAAARQLTTGRAPGIRSFIWTPDAKHLIYGREDSDGARIYALDVNGSKARERVLTEGKGVQARLAFGRACGNARVYITRSDRDSRFADLYSIDLATGVARLEARNDGFADFIVDAPSGLILGRKPRPDGGYDLRRRVGGEWLPFVSLPAEDAETWQILGFDAASGWLYGLDARGGDSVALKRWHIESGQSEQLAAEEGADVRGVIADPLSQVPLAYGAGRERWVWHAIDATVATDLAFLREHGIVDWRLASQSVDNRVWILATHSALRGDEFWIFDRGSKHLRKLFDARPALSGAPLVEMHPVVIPARDGLELVSYLSLPRGSESARADRPKSPLPMVLLAHGGPAAREDYGFHPHHQWLANRGYAVLTVNFRGSTGLGKRFLNAGAGEWGGRMQDDLSDAAQWAVRAGIADPKRIAIFGESYGGYATLVALTREPTRFACGVDAFGPADLISFLDSIPPAWEAARAQLQREVGDPSSHAGRALLFERSPINHAEALQSPLLMAHGALDPVVPKRDSDRLARDLQRRGAAFTYISFSDEGHGFQRLENRLVFGAVVEDFLADCLGGRAEPAAPGLAAASSVKLESGALSPRLRAAFDTPGKK